MEAVEDGLDLVKGLTKADILFPKPPLIDPKTGKRQDGRGPTDIRPLFVQTGVRTSSKGSSYVEMGNTKVVCVVNGPKDLSKKVEFSTTGLISLEIQATGGKVSEKDVIAIKEALEGIVVLDKFPKCLLEVFLTVLEDEGSCIAACITAAGLALIDGGIPVYDTPVASSLLYDGNQFFLDPSKTEQQTLDLTDQTKNTAGGGLVTMAVLPTRDQICLFIMEGKMGPQFVTMAMENLTSTNKKIYAVIRKHCVDLIQKTDEPPPTKK